MVKFNHRMATQTRRWYDRRTRSWVVQTLDFEENQVGSAVYVGSKSEAVAAERTIIADVNQAVPECPRCGPLRGHRFPCVS